MTATRVSIDEGVVVGSGGGRDLLADIFRPEGATGPLPGVLLIHGGGWRTGDRLQLRGYGVLIGREGYVCVATEYRLLGEAPWPAQLDDVRTALAWMHANAAELGIDPDRIAVEGNSAGAHLALLLAGDPALPIKAAIGVYPPVLFLHPDSADDPERTAAMPVLALDDAGGSVELAASASPLRYVTPDYPPTQLIHGSGDELVPLDASLAFHRALVDCGVPADLHIHARQVHAFDAVPEYGRICAAEMVTFLNREL